jgi:hypothetical protein
LIVCFVWVFFCFFVFLRWGYFALFVTPPNIETGERVPVVLFFFFFVFFFVLFLVFLFVCLFVCFVLFCFCVFVLIVFMGSNSFLHCLWLLPLRATGHAASISIRISVCVSVCFHFIANEKQLRYMKFCIGRYEFYCGQSNSFILFNFDIFKDVISENNSSNRKFQSKRTNGSHFNLHGVYRVRTEWRRRLLYA